MSRNLICNDCGTSGKTKTVTRGSIFIEIILWLCLIVPGLIYSIWRLTTRRKACAACGSTHLLPLETPGGIAAAKRFQT